LETIKIRVNARLACAGTQMPHATIGTRICRTRAKRVSAKYRENQAWLDGTHRAYRARMSRELISGVYESLRARCATCGDTIAKHPYCGACGRPRRCDEQDWQTSSDDGHETHCCGTCVRVANL
jgi:hypothetical protein